MADIDEMLAPERMADVIDPLPDWAHSSWCLPGYAGTVVILGYNPYKSTLEDLDVDGASDRWGPDETRIPTSAETASDLHGPWGDVTVGDCVVFVGIAEGSKDPIVWFPQRIVAEDRPRAGWQRVWVVRDMWTEEIPTIEPEAFGGDLTVAAPLRGTPAGECSSTSASTSNALCALGAAESSSTTTIECLSRPTSSPARNRAVKSTRPTPVIAAPVGRSTPTGQSN